MSQDKSFAIGDRVTWTKIAKKGKGVRLSHREGNITVLWAATALVKQGKGEVIVPLTRLRKAGETTELTEFTLGLVAEKREVD